MRPVLLLASLLITSSSAADLPEANRSMDGVSNAVSFRSWTTSLAPLVASQALDAASSYGMRELNPLLASPNGGFETKAASIKLGITGAAVGVEYWIVRRHPGAAHALSKLNWAAGIVTTGFAIHNYAIR
jgi:hypothetical protein